MANYTVNAYNNGGTGGSVNMRSGPSTNDGIVIRVPHGATVTGTNHGMSSFISSEYQTLNAFNSTHETHSITLLAKCA